MRDVLASCKFRYYQNEIGDENIFEEWPQRESVPCIEKAGEKAKRLYFIIRGEVHIMNKEGLFNYGILRQGSYFGDVSILLDIPNQCSYYYNPLSTIST